MKKKILKETIVDLVVSLNRKNKLITGLRIGQDKLAESLEEAEYQAYLSNSLLAQAEGEAQRLAQRVVELEKIVATSNNDRSTFKVIDPKTTKYSNEVEGNPV